MEGQDLQGFAKGSSNAQQYALSFWVKSAKTGVHVVQLSDVENTRSVSGSYTIASADTWEKHSIIFPADTTGALTPDNDYRMQLYFWLYGGSGYNTGSVGDLATTWGATGTTSRASGQVNVFDNTANNWFITGIQFEIGSVATPFEHRSYGDELARCQRYYQRTDDGGCGVGICIGNSSGARIQFSLPVVMRASPTVSKVGNNIYIYDGSQTVQVSGLSQTYGINHSVEWEFDSVASGSALTSGRPLVAYINGGAGGLEMSADL